MQDNNGLIVVALIVGFIWYSNQHPQPGPNPGPTPVVNVVAPSAEMQKAVVSLTNLAAQPNAKICAKAHRDFALVMRANPGRYLTVSRLKLDLQEFGTVYPRVAALSGGMPGLDAAIESSLVACFGPTDKAITDAQASDFVDAIGWALGG